MRSTADQMMNKRVGEFMAKINKKFLAGMLVENFDVKKSDADMMVDNVFGNIVANLDLGNDVEINGFGKFSVVDREGRTGRNPATGEEIQIPAKKVVKFKPALALKSSVA